MAKRICRLGASSSTVRASCAIASGSVKSKLGRSKGYNQIKDGKPLQDFPIIQSVRFT
jgi:hypothetical protein